MSLRALLEKSSDADLLHEMIGFTEALCWAHGRRNFFKPAQLAKAPLGIEAVQRRRNLRHRAHDQ